MYPGVALRKGDPRTDLVRLVQTALGDDGWGEIPVDGVFGPVTESAVRTFQLRADLEPDGIVGPATWAALFGVPAPKSDRPATLLAKLALANCESQVGVRETGGNNRGPEVEKYLASVGKPPGRAWCVALGYWAYQTAADVLHVANPLVKTAGVLDHWDRAPTVVRVPIERVIDDPRNISPGALFCIDYGNRRGHQGMVVTAEAGGVHTIEGNTSPRGSREGHGVYKRFRPYRQINLGFLDYSRL